MASIDDLAAEIAKQVEMYTSEVEKKVKNAENKVTREAVEELKEKSRKRSGDYAEGWQRKRMEDGGIVIYNKTKPQITHLLEKGHVNRDGTRTQAFPHIRPVEEKAIDEFTKLVEKAIKQ